jgi:hypothetical protein
MQLDDIPTEEMEDMNILTAIPFFYDICVRTGCTAVLIDDEPSACSFRSMYITDDHKKHSFQERHHVANDPFALGFGRPSSDQEYVAEWVQ